MLSFRCIAGTDFAGQVLKCARPAREVPPLPARAGFHPADGGGSGWKQQGKIMHHRTRAARSMKSWVTGGLAVFSALAFAAAATLTFVAPEAAYAGSNARTTANVSAD